MDNIWICKYFFLFYAKNHYFLIVFNIYKGLRLFLGGKKV